jgi:2-oxoisovalerate dehydrogenase E2 component (dihydrolipoyl transacylase)
MKIFKLPDLGEGLVEAEIVAWHVKEGAEVKADEPLVAVETDKAIVDIPAPQAGRIVKLYGEVGEIVHIGDPLVEFDSGAPAADAGTVVGELGTSREVISDRPVGVGRTTVAGIKVTPAVRALAQRLDVDLAIVTPSGPDGLITAADVQRVAKILAEAGPLEPLRGVRRSMAHHMAQAHAEVVPVSLLDQADIDAWPAGSDITLRLIRALIAGCAAEPALNAWYDGHAMGRRVLKAIHLGIAMDSPDGLFVAVLHDAGSRSSRELRTALDELKTAVASRRILPEQLRGYTITLSNFGTIAGRHATPVVLPPTVAILGAGMARPEVVALNGEPAVHRVLPLSLTFDHRAVTGGEAGRFLATVIEDLQRPQ